MIGQKKVLRYIDNLKSNQLNNIKREKVKKKEK